MRASLVCCSHRVQRKTFLPPCSKSRAADDQWQGLCGPARPTAHLVQRGVALPVLSRLLLRVLLPVAGQQRLPQVLARLGLWRRMGRWWWWWWWWC